MNYKKLLIFSALFTLLFWGEADIVSAQSKGETKLYKSAVSKGNLKGFEKFLSKYPTSVYAPEVKHLIDSVYYSVIDKNSIASCLGFVSAHPDSFYCDEIEAIITSYVLKDRYIQNDALNQCVLIDSLTSVGIGTESYFYYVYENYSDSYPDLIEYVVSLLDKNSNVSFYAMFSGKKKPSSNMLGYIIEGEIMDKETNTLFRTQEMTYLLNILEHKEFLIPLLKSDIMTDQAIEWWLDHNKGNVRKLDFGILPQESSIVEAFLKAKEYEKSGEYKVALFDIRGYTVICSRKSNQYHLVWCEPVCKNKKTDKILNNIYFESTNSLVLYYYKGKTTYKVRVNLSNKEVRY